MAKATTLPEEIRNWLRARVERDGVTATCRAMNMAEATIARAAGGLPIQAGTVALLETAFRARDEAA
jgi:hypothetical protein